MKTLVKMMVLVTLMTAFTALTSREAKSQHVYAGVSFQLFYDQLSPYGFWVHDAHYGYVWVPDVAPGFYPYATGGHWVFTHYGWTWVSDYPWGWAPFHYGRWHFDPFYGYVWIPGNEWGPAWVVWRHGHGYYGWAPLGPEISIYMAFRPTYVIPHEHWIFVSENNFGRRDIHRHYIDRSSNVNIYNNTTVIQNTYVDRSRNTTYVSGPDREQVRKVTGRAVEPVSIRDSEQPRQHLANNQLEIYRPKVSKSDSRNTRPEPSKVVKRGETKPAAEKRFEGNTKAPVTQPSKQAQPSQRAVRPSPGKEAAPAKKIEQSVEKKSTRPEQRLDQPERKQAASPSQKATPQQQKKSTAPARQIDRPEQQKQVKQAPAQQKQVKQAPTKQTQQRKSAPAPRQKQDSGKNKGRDR